jgi:predicted transcriptional regulator
MKGLFLASGPTVKMELVVKTPHHTTVRLPLEMRQRIEALAEARQTSTSLIIREAIEHFFDAKRGRSESDARHLRVSEYAQLALDWIIQQDHPEVRERLIAEADRRMKIHHGA